MQILPRSAPTRALRSANVSPASFSYGPYNPSPQAPFICSSCRRARSQFRAQQPQQPRRSFSAAAATVPRRCPPPPPPPPSEGYARLTTRRLISVAGVDAPRFLQGIITSSITEPPPDNIQGRNHNRAESGTPRTEGFYSGFLNATGRVLHDVFVYPDTLGLAGDDSIPRGAAFVVEVDAAQLDNLLRHLRRYKLRSKLQLRALEDDECAAWQVWGPEDSVVSSLLASSSSSLSSSPECIVLRDARAPGMGYRVLGRGRMTTTTTTGGPSLALPLPLPLSPSHEAAYRVRRYLLGVAEGQAEIPREQALPLEANMDLMGGIDFRKGCYVGQELTIRTRHRGVVRKRILPCMLYDYNYHDSHSNPNPNPAAATTPAGHPPQHLEYSPEATTPSSTSGQEAGGAKPVLSAEDVPAGLSIGREGKKGRSAGTWLAGAGNVGLALCRLQVMTDVELPGEATAAVPFDPAAHEFVMRLDADGDASGIGGEGGGGRSVKVKAFVPGWLRERLGGDG